MSEHKELIAYARAASDQEMETGSTKTARLLDRLVVALEAADSIEEFSFDHEPMPGLKYVTTNIMLAETMAAAKSVQILTRRAPKWERHAPTRSGGES